MIIMRMDQIIRNHAELLESFLIRVDPITVMNKNSAFRRLIFRIFQMMNCLCNKESIITTWEIRYL